MARRLDWGYAFRERERQAAGYLPTDPLGQWVTSHYAAPLRAQVYQRLKARGFVPPTAAGQPPASTSTDAQPAPAAAPAGLPTDLAQQVGIDDLLAQERGLPGLYNPQRRALMANTERGLTDSGLFDPTRGLFREQREGENVSYGFGRGFEGQAYRDARQGLAAQAAGAGTLYSSGRIDAQRRAQRGLNNQRDAALRQFGQQQDQITTGQQQQYLGIQSQLGQARANYSQWQAAQQAPVPPEPQPVAQPTPQGGAARPANDPYRGWTPPFVAPGTPVRRRPVQPVRIPRSPWSWGR